MSIWIIRNMNCTYTYMGMLKSHRDITFHIKGYGFNAIPCSHHGVVGFVRWFEMISTHYPQRLTTPSLSDRWRATRKRFELSSTKSCYGMHKQWIALNLQYTWTGAIFGIVIGIDKTFLMPSHRGSRFTAVFCLNRLIGGSCTRPSNLLLIQSQHLIYIVSS